MALLFENNYYRLIKVTKDLIYNKIDAEMLVYKSDADRNLEKNIEPLRNAFISASKQYLTNKYAILQKAISDLQEKVNREGVAFHELLYNNTELKEMNNDYNNMAQEFNIINTNLFTYGIDLDTLIYKENWVSLGLTPEICVPSGAINRVKFSLDIVTDNLSEIYTNIKEKFLIGAEDC